MEKFMFYLEKNPVVALLVGFGIGYLIIMLSLILILAVLISPALTKRRSSLNKNSGQRSINQNMLPN